MGSLSKEDINNIYLDYEKHMHDGVTVENYGIIVVLDVLGWKNNMQETDINSYFQLINKLRSMFLDTSLRYSNNKELSNIRISTLSDTIVVLINGTTPYHELNVFKHISIFLTDALKKGFMFRGAISRGKYYTNKQDNAFVGEPYYEAAKYAESTEWAGVIIADSLADALLKNNSVADLIELNIIEYDEIPFKDSISPLKNNLVLLPNREMCYEKMGNKKSFDFIGRYKELMEKSPGNEVKYNNTKRLFEYITINYWK